MTIFVDIIIPVHNAESTIEETVHSAMRQCIPSHLLFDEDDGHDKSNDTDEFFIYDDNNHTSSSEEKIMIGGSQRRFYSTYYLDDYDRCSLCNVDIDVAVCCYDDGSSDNSFNLLKELKEKYDNNNNMSMVENDTKSIKVRRKKNKIISTRLYIGKSVDGVARGAGYARNQAASLRKAVSQYYEQTDSESSNHHSDDKIKYFICLLDSDDIMHQHRIAEQVSVMLQMESNERNSTILGCTFSRIPEDSTWHYTTWANNLTDERLMLERFREVTVLQPTWMLTRCRFDVLNGYIEAPHPNIHQEKDYSNHNRSNVKVYKLIHPTYDNAQTLRLAEDLRFFHAHLNYQDHNHNTGSLKLIRTADGIEKLLKYRHRVGQSQSSSTSRKLLLQLRTKAFVDTILLQNEHNDSSPLLSGSNVQNWLYCKDTNKDGFVIWGAGRDGKEFFKALPDHMKHHVRCFVDVDEKKINSGYYIVPGISLPINESKGKPHKTSPSLKVPIVHFSLLAKDKGIRQKLMDEWMYPSESKHEEEREGKITKCKPKDENDEKKRKRMKVDENDDNLIKVTISTSTTITNVPSTKTNISRKLHALTKNDKQNLKLIETLHELPVVVCVAMYRSNGILEKNVANIGRKEGFDLWHFS